MLGGCLGGFFGLLACLGFLTLYAISLALNEL